MVLVACAAKERADLWHRRRTADSHLTRKGDSEPILQGDASNGSVAALLFASHVLAGKELQIVCRVAGGFQHHHAGLGIRLPGRAVEHRVHPFPARAAGRSAPNATT
jgi:hypothetical protein